MSYTERYAHHDLDSFTTSKTASTAWIHSAPCVFSFQHIWHSRSAPRSNDNAHSEFCLFILLGRGPAVGRLIFYLFSREQKMQDTTRRERRETRCSGICDVGLRIVYFISFSVCTVTIRHCLVRPGSTSSPTYNDNETTIHNNKLAGSTFQSTTYK